MAVTTTNTNKPINPRGDDKSPLAFNRAKIYSGKALDFDGANDSVSTGTQTAFDMKSIAFYFIGAINSNANGFVMHPNDASYNNGVMIGHFSGTLTDECLSIGDGSNFTTTKETFDDGIHFVVFSWDATNSKYKIFVNGVELTTENNGADSSLISDITSPIFGKRAPLNDFYLDGGLSNIRLFNTALTAAQVLDLYNNPEKIVPTGVADSALKLWLPMQEGAGTTAYDGSGNGNHGTISGATWTHGVGSPVAQTAVIDWNKGVNHLAYSSELDNAYWNKGGTTISSNYATAPDGLTTADKIVSTSGTGEQRVYKASGLTSVGNTYTYHAFVKADGANWLVCRDDFRGYGDTSFDLINGVVGTTASGRTASISAFGDYYFVSVQVTITSSVVSGQVMFCLADADNGRASFVGDGTKGIILWGAGINNGTSVVHIPTLSTAQTSDVLLPQGLTSGYDITGVNQFENVRKQYALNLDGQSWAEVHDNESLDFGTGSFSLEAWVRTKYVSQGSVYNTIMTLGGDVAQANNTGLTNTSSRFYITYNTNGTLSGSITEGEWVHIVGSYDETNVTLYINNIQVDQDARTAVDITNDLVKMIGRDATVLRYYSDQIAQPRIYNRALTADEVEQNYNAGKNTYS